MLFLGGWYWKQKQADMYIKYNGTILNNDIQKSYISNKTQQCSETGHQQTKQLTVIWLLQIQILSASFDYKSLMNYVMKFDL